MQENPFGKIAELLPVANPFAFTCGWSWKVPFESLFVLRAKVQLEDSPL